MKKSVMIDVREKDEFDTEHVEGSIFIPLSEFDRLAQKILSDFAHCDVTIMCRSGKRAGIAKEQAQKLRIPGLTLTVYEGGILKWKEQGKPTRSRSS